ncbi:DUF58 domain-containing protein [Sulfurirhabdus autotrophica]|uniref:Uncharacterized protein DUF58 n=1 Tax=Sulfurirhabdus autotrophica TaxID=1706046 RepID=A0A4R3YAQ8_9PROT|nr:DUF58 domain-containing protein [Sulfurirhabdus autotrophica]TCV89495.1 uncharacterized protein DUF58 [Sulfurirhabdus autotrophica]
MILPDLTELVAMRGAAHGLSLHTHRPALAMLHGGHRSAQRGRGLDFEEVRRYAPGDDARTIDWRVTARRGQLYTKLFREERERPVWLVADLHSGLFFGSRYQLKSALLLRTASMLAWVAALGGDRLGALITNNQSLPQIFPPRAREAGVLPVLEALVEAQPKMPGAPDEKGLNLALASLRPLLQPGSLVMILSDFSGLNDLTEASLAGIAFHNDCRLLWLTDPLESSGLPTGKYRVGLPGQLWWMNGEQSRTAWQEKWAARETRLDQIARRLNLPLIRLDTQNPVTETLPPLLRESTW